MVTGDKFECILCNYRWITKKSWGNPSFCPDCKCKNIFNVDERLREEMDKYWKSDWRRKTRFKEIIKKIIRKRK